jgi:hypothetical protein
VQVIKLFQPLLFGVNAKRIEPSLPEPILDMIMNCRGQAQTSQHLPAPTAAPVLPQDFENPRPRALFELLHNPAGRRSHPRLDKHMKMIRHQDPAKQPEGELGPNLLKSRDEFATESRAQENRSATVSARRDELQLAGGEVTRSRHVR